MPSNLITTLFAICVSFAVAVILILAPPLVDTKIKMDAIAQDAARVYAITGDIGATQSEINADLMAAHLPTTWDGQTLVSVTPTTVGSSQPGYATDSSPTSTNAGVEIQYNAPIPFDRALTLFGGPALSATIPMTASATQWNEVQYTGVGP
ncbi:hypothetical protein [Ferroacidibacillus organovorans]|uniref:Uncharacterized protein n=1 Tax=Ferroacidibacillus organovorans TaxID=1765683 RepID=A0A853KC62_9BACL|nr:hypothetical protein [Ferroacidibacillus organovorans]KYP79896.1 hypothetical protein AYJ22_03075 [Ferroacidibacillus organovorans]OAG94626.1 hypothetical protein AYW79_04540 [Ferroacidibacillus organovorans]